MFISRIEFNTDSSNFPIRKSISLSAPALRLCQSFPSSLHFELWILHAELSANKHCFGRRCQCIALLPHTSRIPGSVLCVWNFACSLYLCMGFVRVRRFPPTFQKQAGMWPQGCGTKRCAISLVVSEKKSDSLLRFAYQ